jgi:hypothetical protein
MSSSGIRPRDTDKVINLQEVQKKKKKKRTFISPVEVLWVVTLCSAVVGYQHFRGPCCLQL